MIPRKSSRSCKSHAPVELNEAHMFSIFAYRWDKCRSIGGIWIGTSTFLIATPCKMVEFMNSSIIGKGMRLIRNSLISCMSNHQLQSLPQPPLCVPLYPAAVVWLIIFSFQASLNLSTPQSSHKQVDKYGTHQHGAKHSPTLKVAYGIGLSRKMECSK